MFGLETIIKMNETAVSKPDAIGWETFNLGGGNVAVTGPNYYRLVNASNPLIDDDLVAFHNEPGIPDSIHAQVEGYASQHRRMVHSSNQWDEKIAEKMLDDLAA